MGCAQLRAGQTKEAISTLKKSLAGHSIEMVATPNSFAAIQFSRLVGETILALAYYRDGDQEALGKQIAAVRPLVERLEKSPPKPGTSAQPWAIPFAIQMAKRELAAIAPPPTESTGEGDPK